MKSIIIKFTILTFAVLTLQGCYLKSVHPLFTAEDAIILENLDGIYETENHRWEFASARSPDRLIKLMTKLSDDEFTPDSSGDAAFEIDAYLVLFESKEDPNERPVLFLGKVGEINGDYFLNLKILEIVSGLAHNFVDYHRFDVNSFSRIEVSENELVMEPFASSWIRDQIMENRVRIKHEVISSDLDDSGEILITAPTHELQQFIEKYGNTKDAYEKALFMNRMPYDVQ